MSANYEKNIFLRTHDAPPLKLNTILRDFERVIKTVITDYKK